MSTRKWGESFLKSGLPLEHITLVTFKSLGYYSSPSIEYESRDGTQEKWREIDLFASSPDANGDTDLGFLVECKYHDLQRFWFFLPCNDGRWQFDDRVFNCGPIQTLRHPSAKGALDLAPLSHRGLVVAEDGTKQENAVGNAIQQVASGFVPFALGHFVYNLDVIEGYPPSGSAIVPMIVTNAKMFRLRPEKTNLDEIRAAAKPTDIADELPWTWCYNDPSMESFGQNLENIDLHLNREKEVLDDFSPVLEAVRTFSSRPNWIAIVNLDHLSESVEAIHDYFMSLKTLRVARVLGKRQTKSAK